MRPNAMPPRDYDEETPVSPEKTPGVYTRAENKQPNDLDLLWSGSKLYHKDDRSPLVPFLAGFILSAILTTAVFLVLNNQPKTKPTDNTFIDKAIENPVTPDPSSDNGDATTAASGATSGADNATTATSTGNTARSSASHTVKVPDVNNRPVTTTASQPGANSVQFSSYTVRNGDTLSTIAKKVYGNSSPDKVEKIQRANKMKNANALQLDQKLVIPPLN